MVTEQPRVFIQHCPVGVLGSGWLGRCCRWRGCWHRGGCHVCLHWRRRLLCQHHAAGRVCFPGTGYLVRCHHAGNDKLAEDFGRGVDELPCPHSSLHVVLPFFFSSPAFGVCRLCTWLIQPWACLTCCGSTPSLWSPLRSPSLVCTHVVVVS